MYMQSTILRRSHLHSFDIHSIVINKFLSVTFFAKALFSRVHSSGFVTHYGGGGGGGGGGGLSLFTKTYSI